MSEIPMLCFKNTLWDLLTCLDDSLAKSGCCEFQEERGGRYDSDGRRRCGPGQWPVVYAAGCQRGQILHTYHNVEHHKYKSETPDQASNEALIFPLQDYERLSAQLDGAKQPLTNKVQNFTLASSKSSLVEKAEKHAELLNQLSLNLSRCLKVPSFILFFFF